MMETAGKPRLAIVVSSFNRSVTDALLEGAREAVDATGVLCDAEDVFAVPGAFSISKRSFWPFLRSMGPLAMAPSRSLGPCRSIRIAIGCLYSFSSARSRSTRCL